MVKTRIVRSKADENPPILKENEIVKFTNLIDGGEHYWSYVEYVIEEIEEQDEIEIEEEEMLKLIEHLDAREGFYAILEIANKKLKSENKKLKKAIAILNRIYGFKLQDIKYSGYYELLIPDMTSDELSKEEYELLDEVLNGK